MRTKDPQNVGRIYDVLSKIVMPRERSAYSLFVNIRVLITPEIFSISFTCGSYIKYGFAQRSSEGCLQYINTGEGISVKMHLCIYLNIRIGV